MNKLFLKIGDFLLCFMGTVLILAGIVAFGRPSDKHSPQPISHYTQPYSVMERIQGKNK
ncbi:hypothetical protein LQZ19_10410 [Treponema primitia]|uniref:hypothetical protein n=1 Tax=Treponema primitia TaxID=88058 RepID=UPI0039819130